MGLEQRIADVEAIIIRAESNLLLQKDAPDSIDPRRHLVPLERKNVLMTLRAVVLALVFVQAEVKLGAMLNNGLVKRREQHVVFIIERRHGNNHQAVILRILQPTKSCCNKHRTCL